MNRRQIRPAIRASLVAKLTLVFPKISRCLEKKALKMGTVLELTKRGAKGIARYLSTTKGDNNSNGKMKMRKRKKNFCKIMTIADHEE